MFKFYPRAASTSDALWNNNEPSHDLNDDNIFHEINPEIFPDDDDIDTSLLSTDLFLSDALSDLDDSTTLFLADTINNPAASCDSSPLIKVRSSSSSDACQQNTVNSDSDSSIFKKEDTVQETQEQVERWWCSGNREQSRGKLPLCAFTYENQDVEIMLDGFLCSFFLFSVFDLLFFF